MICERKYIAKLTPLAPFFSSFSFGLKFVLQRRFWGARLRKKLKKSGLTIAKLLSDGADRTP